MNSSKNEPKLCVKTAVSATGQPGGFSASERGAKEFLVRKVTGAEVVEQADLVSTELPLELRISSKQLGERFSLAVTMRTPGHDAELAAGFLFTEGLVTDRNAIEDIFVEKCNTVTVRLRDSVNIDKAKLERHSYVASSCGVCGKKSIESVRVSRKFEMKDELPLVSAALIQSLPAKLREMQTNFDCTGGVHASLLVDSESRFLGLKEDVGRHNALDKVIGEQFLRGNLPLSDAILLVSGRASFELVQKAALAGIPVLLAVGAPSSLAVELAIESNMTLIGFVRDMRFNVYSGAQRVLLNQA